jgi:hypothetical protein
MSISDNDIEQAAYASQYSQTEFKNDKARMLKFADNIKQFIEMSDEDNSTDKTSDDYYHIEEPDSGIMLPHEAADAITVATLKDAVRYMQKELDDHFERGQWMHIDDIVNNRELIYCITRVLRYFGS